MKKSLLFIAFLFLSFGSCTKKSKSETLKISKPKVFKLLEKAEWFIGNWENITKEATFKEIWNKESDSTFVGESFVFVEKDTVFYEKIDLFQQNDSLFYRVSVKDQNKEQPVVFYLTKSNEKELIFENPKHDFPTKIVYTKITNDSMVGAIYGKKNGMKISETFPMKKAK